MAALRGRHLSAIPAARHAQRESALRFLAMASRFSIVVISLVLMLTASSGALGASSAETSNPINDQGSSFHYRSYVRTIEPHIPGLELQVLEFADRLLLTNHTGKSVTIYGYEDEPYARDQADGTVEVNTNSPAYYLNQNFYGAVSVPAHASSHAAAHWLVVDRTGQFEWHDHRIHWMSPVTPPQVKNQHKRTKIFNWTVPIQVGSQKASVDGELFWIPESSSTPLAAIISLVALCLLALAFVLFVRRRRSRPSSLTEEQTPDSEQQATRPSREAW